MVTKAINPRKPSGELIGLNAGKSIKFPKRPLRETPRANGKEMSIKGSGTTIGERNLMKPAIYEKIQKKQKVKGINSYTKMPAIKQTNK